MFYDYAANCFCCQVPCKFNGGVVVDVDRFRTSMGGWVRLLFKNVNGSPLSKVELSHVSDLNSSIRGSSCYTRTLSGKLLKQPNLGHDAAPTACSCTAVHN
jgi:hypothetical protein